MRIAPPHAVRYEDTQAYYLYPVPDPHRGPVRPPPLAVHKPLPKRPSLVHRVLAKLCLPLRGVP